MSMINHKAANNITSSVVVNKSTEEKKSNYNSKEVRKKRKEKWLKKQDKQETEGEVVEFKHNHTILSEKVVINIQIKRQRLSDCIKSKTEQEKMHLRNT